ncbi:MAG: cyclic nucleotide-binding domain-containing protein [Limibacillus sp.]|jgi:CRP-like cAMP-binding protein
MQRKTFSAGTLIFSAEEHPEEAYLLMSGEVEIRRDGFTASPKRGEIFGESALMGRPRMASASAKTDCSVLVFSREEMEEAIRRDPTQAFEIIDGLLTRLADVTDQLNKARAGTG